MDSDYFRQIVLPFSRKTEILHALMRFIADQPGPVPRENAFFERFIAERHGGAPSRKPAVVDPWLTEHVARLFWVCCELKFLQYQYPYPHLGQTYLPTRAGRLIASAPQRFAYAFIGVAYIFAILAGPIKQFSRIRNVVAAVTGALLWWRHEELSPLIVVVSVAAGVVGTWIASFFSQSSDTD